MRHELCNAMYVCTYVGKYTKKMYVLFACAYSINVWRLHTCSLFSIVQVGGRMNAAHIWLTYPRLWPKMSLSTPCFCRLIWKSTSQTLLKCFCKRLKSLFCFWNGAKLPLQADALNHVWPYYLHLVMKSLQVRDSDLKILKNQNESRLAKTGQHFLSKKGIICIVAYMTAFWQDSDLIECQLLQISRNRITSCRGVESFLHQAHCAVAISGCDLFAFGAVAHGWRLRKPLCFSVLFN